MMIWWTPFNFELLVKGCIWLRIKFSQRFDQKVKLKMNLSPCPLTSCVRCLIFNFAFVVFFQTKQAVLDNVSGSFFVAQRSRAQRWWCLNPWSYRAETHLQPCLQKCVLSSSCTEEGIRPQAVPRSDAFCRARPRRATAAGGIGLAVEASHNRFPQVYNVWCAICVICVIMWCVWLFDVKTRVRPW